MDSPNVKWLIGTIIVACCIYLVYRKNNQPTYDVQPQTSRDSASAETFSSQDFGPGPEKDFPEYQPVKIGTTWTYQIKIGEVEPIFYKEIRWHTYNQELITTATRGRFLGYMKNPQKKEFLLKLAIDSIAPTQCELEYGNGYKLKIISDELVVYPEALNLYWAITPNSSGFQLLEVIEMDPEGPFSAVRPMTKQGCALSMKIYAQSPGVSISVGPSGADSILFMGFEAIPGTNQKGLHYLRTVKAKEEDNFPRSDLDDSFTEDSYYQEGIGLVFLQQKVNGKVSMTWTLVPNTFKPGKGVPI